MFLLCLNFFSPFTTCSSFDLQLIPRRFAFALLLEEIWGTELTVPKCSAQRERDDNCGKRTEYSPDLSSSSSTRINGPLSWSQNLLARWEFQESQASRTPGARIPFILSVELALNGAKLRILYNNPTDSYWITYFPVSRCSPLTLHVGRGSNYYLAKLHSPVEFSTQNSPTLKFLINARSAYLIINQITFAFTIMTGVSNFKRS